MHWILIANASGARLLEQPQAGKPIVLQTFEHPASRVHSATLGDDRAGWSMGHDRYGGAPYNARDTAQHKERIQFAVELAQFLEQRAQENRFDALTLFAPPDFLGELRSHLGQASARRVSASRAVDLTHVGLAELGQRIEHELAAAT